MANTILNILAQGYSAITVLNGITRKFPKYKKAINTALTAGYTAESILKKLSGVEGKNEHRFDVITEDQKNYYNFRAQRQKEKAQFLGSVAGGATGIAGLSIGLPALGAAGKTAAQAAPVMANSGSPPPQSGGGILPGLATAAASLPTSQSETRIPDQLIPSEAQGPQVQGGNLGQLMEAKATQQNLQAIKKYAPDIARRMEQEAQAGRPLEETARIFANQPAYQDQIKKLEKQTGTPFMEALQSAYSGRRPAVTGNEPQILEPGQAIPNAPRSEMPEMAPVHLPKGETIITPVGAGKVHKVHGNDAYVEVDNKLQKVPKEELTTPPPDVLKAVTDILKIPEIDRSSNVALFTYDPQESKMYIQFHDGSHYKYLNIDPEVVQKLAEKEATPITSGENAYGAWDPKDKHGSLGAALWQYVLKDPKYAKPRKGEPPNPNYIKLETLYDYWKDLRIKKKK